MRRENLTDNSQAESRLESSAKGKSFIVGDDNRDVSLRFLESLCPELDVQFPEVLDILDLEGRIANLRELKRESFCIWNLSLQNQHMQTVLKGSRSLP